MNAPPLSVRETSPVRKMKYVLGLMNAAADMDILEQAVIPSAQPSSGVPTVKGSVTAIPMASVMT